MAFVVCSNYNLYTISLKVLLMYTLTMNCISIIYTLDKFMLGFYLNKRFKGFKRTVST